MNPYRTEKVLVDIRKRSVPNPIAVVASTDVEVELSVLADGTAYDCSGMTGSKAVFYISQDGRADTFGAVEARRGKLVFRIPAGHLGYPGEYRWQIVVSDGERFSEWARGDFFIRTNPAADFEPMQLLDPPWLKSADFENVEEVSVGTLKNVAAKVNELVRILKGATGVLALALLATTAQGIPFDEVLPSTPVNTNLIGAAIGDGLTLTNGALVATMQGGGLTTNDVEAIVAADASIARYDSNGGLNAYEILAATNNARAAARLQPERIMVWGEGEYGEGEGSTAIYFPVNTWGTMAVREDLADYARTDSLGTAAFSDVTDFATASAVASVTQRVDVASSAVVRYATGVLSLTVPANATLAPNLVGWPDGAAVFARVSANGAYSVAQGLSLIGYGFWPTNSATVVFVRDGQTVRANVVQGN